MSREKKPAEGRRTRRDVGKPKAQASKNAKGKSSISQASSSKQACVSALSGGSAQASAESDGLMRLQKFLARAGVASRRSAEKLIEEGRVSINGKPAKKLGTKVNPATDTVCVDGEAVSISEENVTLVLHKPAGYVTTMFDPQGRPCVADLVPTDEYPSLYPIGRLDSDTTGLLLFSTDGELGNALLHPRRHVTKVYLALVQGRPPAAILDYLREGVLLDDGVTMPADIELLEGSEREEALALIGKGKGASGWAARKEAFRAQPSFETECSLIRVGLREGRNRQIRRMFEEVRHPVIALHRETFGSLSLGSVPRGEWKLLSSEEVAELECMAGR